MGGPGSGTWYRWDKKTTTEEVHRVDIRYLRRQRFLRPGVGGSLTWSRGGEQTGWIRFKVEQDAVVFLYRHCAYGTEWRSVEERVWFDRTACHFGGERLWFLCPHCGRRVAVLYGAGIRFLCRHCYALPYASQNETRSDRLMRKARKIRQRLDASDSLCDPIWEKPRGMHWKTFERLVRAERAANDASMLAIADELKILDAWETL